MCRKRNMETSRARSVPQIIGSGNQMGHQRVHLKHAKHSIWSLRAFWGLEGGITKAVIFYVPGPVRTCPYCPYGRPSDATCGTRCGNSQWHPSPAGGHCSASVTRWPQATSLQCASSACSARHAGQRSARARHLHCKPTSLQLHGVFVTWETWASDPLDTTDRDRDHGWER